MPTLVNDVREEGEDFTDAVVSRHAAKKDKVRKQDVPAIIERLDDEG